MSDSAAVAPETAPAPVKPPLTEIQVFYRKAFTVVVAILAIMFVLYLMITNEIETLTENFQAQFQTQISDLQGGPKFWARIESNLYQYADAPDMPPERKARIVAAIKKAADKNRAFIDALTSK